MSHKNNGEVSQFFGQSVTNDTSTPGCKPLRYSTIYLYSYNKSTVKICVSRKLAVQPWGVRLIGVRKVNTNAYKLWLSLSIEWCVIMACGLCESTWTPNVVTLNAVTPNALTPNVLTPNSFIQSNFIQQCNFVKHEDIYYVRVYCELSLPFMVLICSADGFLFGYVLVWLGNNRLVYIFTIFEE